MKALETALTVKELENLLTIEGSKHVIPIVTEEEKLEEVEDKMESLSVETQLKVNISIEPHLYGTINDLIKKNKDIELFKGAVIEFEQAEVTG
jgi:hypothetical protein